MSEIKPALTAEEWVAWLKDGARVPEGVNACYFDVFSRRKEDGSRHTQAAVALHGQPFGFTREDLDGLRIMMQREGPRIHMYGTVATLADRIEALLPPEEKQ